MVRSTRMSPRTTRRTDRVNAVAAEQPAKCGSFDESTGSQEGRQEETTNYEISKTVRNTVRTQPQVERITLAVMVDGIDELGPDGKHARPARNRHLEATNGWRRAPSALGHKCGDWVDGPRQCHSSTRWVRRRHTRPRVPTRPRRDLISLAEAMGAGPYCVRHNRRRYPADL